MADIFDIFKKIESSRREVLPVTHIIAGLGNPGEKYTFTRHNMGFLALDFLTQQENFKIDRLRFHALCGEHTVGGVRALFMKPQTFMNLSGDAVREAAAFYKISPENIIILCDDAALPAGKLRIRLRGSAGGHNGLKSIIEQLGTDEFPRIKIGVGAPPPEYDFADWVLSQLPPDDRKAVFERYSDVRPCLELMLAGRFNDAMNKFN